MPSIGFICPDSNTVSFAECFEKCRMKDQMEAGRCLSIRTLKAISYQRNWNGIPSTTQLLKGTRESYLTLTRPFYIDPQGQLFALHGTKIHDKLDEHTPKGSRSEERLFDGVSSGAFDFYSKEDGGTLYDVKTYGSYAAAKTIGIKEVWIPDGHYKSGAKAGQAKYKKELRFDGRKNRFNLAVQLNDYRMKLEKEGCPVSNMICEIIVRDGNTYIARNRGVDFTGRLVVINKISDQWVSRYMKKKADDLHYYLEHSEMPPICRPKERWLDAKTGKCMKCLYYCNVAQYCDYGISQAKQFSINNEGE